MTWSEFTGEIQRLLPLHINRQGWRTFLEKQMRIACIDLMRHIPDLRRGQTTTYAEDDLVVEGECSRGELPDTAAAIVSAQLNYTASGKTCCGIPLREYTGSEDDLICGAIRGAYVNTIRLIPRSGTFYVYPRIEDDMRVVLKWDGVKLEYEELDEVPFGEECQNAVRLWVEAEIARSLDRDAGLYSSLKADYIRERQLIFATAAERSRVRMHSEPTCDWETCAAGGGEGEGVVDFVALGDIGYGNTYEAGVAGMIKQIDPDFILMLGDLLSPSGQLIYVEDRLLKYYDAWIPDHSYPLLGNHDQEVNTTWLASVWPNLSTFNSGKFYYKISKGDGILDIFVLNSGFSDDDPREADGITYDSVQGQWLQTSLAESSADWKIVAFHRAPYCSDVTRGPGSTAMRWPFKDWGADLVLNGHAHNYERLLVDGFPYLVSGTGGADLREFSDPPSEYSQFRYNTFHGALRLNVTEDRLQAIFHNYKGSVIDNVTYFK